MPILSDDMTLTASESVRTTPEASVRCADVDLCITLGGDGTVLHLASLFVADEPLPPVVSFAMGTLGFLTPFDVTDFAATLTRVRPAEGLGFASCSASGFDPDALRLHRLRRHPHPRAPESWRPTPYSQLACLTLLCSPQGRDCHTSCCVLCMWTDS